MARYAQRNDFMYHRHTCAVWSITAAAVLAYQMPLATAALRAAESSARARGSAAAAVPGRTQAELRGTVLSKETRQPVPCTVTILDSNGQTVTDGKGYRWGFRSSGVFTKLLPPGRTKVRITRGPELRAMEREPSFQAALSIVETGTAWYCVRVFGTDERRQGAISGAFFFDERPRRPPAPVKARVRATVVEAGSGRPLDATLTEIRQVATEPQPGTQHRIQGEVAMLSILATMRLRADAVGFEPLTLSPLFDHPPLIETVTRLEDKDLVD